MGDGSEKIITIKNVSFSYNAECILEDINLSVSRGDFLAIIGPNGSGKTTLLKLVLGLLAPQKGRVRVFGHAPSRVSDRIGYVPQQLNFRPDFPVTVINVVLLGLVSSRVKGWRFTRHEQERAREALGQVDMLGYQDRRISELSGGQLQRVIIARALVSRPSLLLLDEPTSNIDAQGQFCFYEFLGELNKSISIVIVSHDIHIVSTRVTSVACVNKNLYYSPRPELTREMLALLYGEHDKNCPASAALAEMLERFSVGRKDS